VINKSVPIAPEAALGRKMDAGALAIGGKDLAENTLEALILSGKSRADAMAMMRDPGFQQGVLAQLDNIMHVNDVVLKKTQADVGPMVDEYMSSAAGSLVIKTPVVTEGEQNAQQATLSPLMLIVRTTSTLQVSSLER